MLILVIMFCLGVFFLGCCVCRCVWFWSAFRFSFLKSFRFCVARLYWNFFCQTSPNLRLFRGFVFLSFLLFFLFGVLSFVDALVGIKKILTYFEGVCSRFHPPRGFLFRFLFIFRVFLLFFDLLGVLESVRDFALGTISLEIYGSELTVLVFNQDVLRDFVRDFAHACVRDFAIETLSSRLSFREFHQVRNFPFFA